MTLLLALKIFLSVSYVGVCFVAHSLFTSWVDKELRWNVPRTLFRVVSEVAPVLSFATSVTVALYGVFNIPPFVNSLLGI